MLNFLKYLSQYENEDVEKVEKILEQKKSKIDAIIKEAFFGDFVTKTEAIMTIQNEFVDEKKAPKTIDVKFLKENMTDVIKKVESLTEGDIKIVVNNYEGSKQKPTASVISDIDNSDDIEFESTKPKKRGRPSKSQKAEEIAKKTAKKISKKNEENVKEIEEELEIKDDEVEEEVENELEEEEQKFVVTAFVKKKNMRDTISKPLNRKDAETFKKNKEEEMKMGSDDYQWIKDIRIEPAKPDVYEEVEEPELETLKWEEFEKFITKDDVVEELDDEENVDEVEESVVSESNFDNVKVYKGEDDPDYTVVIGDDVFEMDDNSLPNGVNMYSGSIDEIDLEGKEEIPEEEWSEGLRTNIERRLDQVEETCDCGSEECECNKNDDDDVVEGWEEDEKERDKEQREYLYQKDNDEDDVGIGIDDLDIEEEPLDYEDDDEYAPEKELDFAEEVEDDMIDMESGDEEMSQIEPDEEDCFISNNTRGGYDVSCGGEYIDNFVEFDDAIEAVRNWQDESNVFPAIWMVSDHGNHVLIDRDGNEIKEEVESDESGMDEYIDTKIADFKPRKPKYRFDIDNEEIEESKGSFYVWVWGNDGKKILFRGSEKECKNFKKEYRGYRQEDIYISKSDSY